MTYKDSTPTFNTGNRKIVNYKDFIQHEPQEEAELKKMKRQFKKADQVKAVNQDHQSKYNKVTHKNDDLVKAEIEDKLDALEENTKYEEKILNFEIEASVGDRFGRRLLVKTDEATYYIPLNRISPTTKF